MMIKNQYRKIILLTFFSGILVLAVIWAVAAKIHVPRVVLMPDAVSVESDRSSAVYAVRLPRPADDRVHCLMFKSKGNIIDIQMGPETIFTYGREAAAAGRDIGRIYVCAPVPAEGYAQPLTVRLTPNDANASTRLHKIELCPQSDSTRYYLTNDTLGLPLALLFIAIGFCSVLLALFVRSQWSLSRLSLLFGLLLLSVSVELLDTGGHYLLFFTDQYTWNILFYLVSYLLPVVCTLYFYFMVKERFSTAQRRVIWIGILGNVLFGLTAIGLVLVTPLRFSDFARGYSYSLLYCGCFAVYGIYQIIRKGLMSKVGMLFTLVMVIWLLVASGFSYWALPLVNLSGVTRLDLETIQAVFIFYAISAMFITTILKNVREQREKELKVLHLENQLTKSHLRYFARQMQPHFLYNTLLSIQEAVLDQPVYAARLIGDFTTYLKGCIASIGSDVLIPFCRELSHIQAYVHIEEMRFSDRLKVCYDTSAEDFLVLPLSIQPLVENAIRHGIYGRGPVGGTVTVRSFEQAEAWVIEVSDNGVGFDSETVLSSVAAGERDSHALRNIIFRLEQGMHATVDIRSVIDSGTVVTIRIPKSSQVSGPPKIESEQNS